MKFALLGLLVASPAFAYLPPSQFIVKNLVNKRSASLKSVRLKSHVTAMLGGPGSEKPAGAQLSVTTTYNVQSGALRVVVREEAGKDLYLLERAPGTLPSVDTFLFNPRLDEVIRVLRDRGIPIRTEDELQAMQDESERRASEVEYLSRWKGTYAWVIGRRTSLPGEIKDNGRIEPQLWVEKDSFSPLRLVLQNPGIAGGSPNWVDLRFEALRYTRGFSFPKSITLAEKDGTILLREELSDIGINPPAPKGEETLKTPGFTEAGNLASAETRALIQKFVETIR